MKKILFLLCMFTLILTAGCGGSEDVKSADNEQKIVLEYTDYLKSLGFNEPVILEKKPERVVSLVHTPVLALYEMGINQVAIPENKMFAWPEELDKQTVKLNVSMNDNFDIESIVALKPDLVIVGYQAKDSYGKILEREKIPVYYTDAGHVVSYQSVKDLTYKLIAAFGKDNEGAKNIAARFDELEQRIKKISAANSEKKVMVLQSAPPRHFIQSKEGTLGNMADLLGYKNVYSDEKNKLVLLDREQALSYDPDLILCVGAAKAAADHQKVMEEDFAKNPEYWYAFKAVKEGNIVYLPMKYIASTGINIIDDLHELMDILEKEKL